MSNQTPHTSSANCKPGNRCHKWRTCPDCAVIRQARTADTAEATWPDPSAACIYTARATPGSKQTIDQTRRALHNALGKVRGIWTIEASEVNTSLHIHALADRVSVKNHRSIIIHQSNPCRSIRAAAAYITKATNAPSPEQYKGRLIGTWGQLTRHLLTDGLPATIQGAAIEQMLSDTIDLPAHDQAPPPPIIDGQRTRSVAAYYLQRLHQLARAIVPNKRP